MKFMLTILLAVMALVISPLVLKAANPEHPKQFIDEGACPGEGCVFGSWKVQKETLLYAEPNEKSKRIGKCLPNSTVIALTGQVNSVAGKFTVKKKKGTFNPGDIIWVYTYLGEGYFKVWVDGVFEEMERL